MRSTFERLHQRQAKTGQEHGFTLIEVLIVIVILAILAAIVVIGVGSVSRSSARASCESDVQTVENGVLSYETQMGKPPTTVSALLSVAPAGSGVNADTPGPWLHNTPINQSHYEVMLADGSTVYTATGGTAAPAGLAIVEGFDSITHTYQSAPNGSVFDPSGGTPGAVTTPSAACTGIG